MRRIAITIALFTAACIAAFAAPPDLPTINGIPAMFGTIASGTGTATEYIQYVPILVNPVTGSLIVESAGPSSAAPGYSIATGSNSGAPALPVYTVATGAAENIKEYVTFATRTVSIAAGSVVNLGALVPSGSQGFRFRAFGDTLVVNTSTALATGTFSCGDEVASGSVFTWDGPAYNGDIFVAAKSGLVATFTIWGW